MVASNTTFEGDDSKLDGFKRLAKEGKLRRYTVIERGGLRFGIFGVLGKEAMFYTGGAAPAKFTDPVETAKEMVKILRETEKVDVVIALSHGGMTKGADGKFVDGEDVQLPKAVPGIDIVIGSHSHTELHEAIIVNGRTPVVQTGKYGENLGELVISIDGDKLTVESYKLHPVDDTVPGDKAMADEIEGLKKSLTRFAFASRGYSIDQPLAIAPRDIVNTFTDIPASTLVTGYFTGLELKNMLEFFLVDNPAHPGEYFPRTSGLKIRYDMSRAKFDVVTALEIGDIDRGYKPIGITDKDEQLYSLTTPLYLAAILVAIPKYSKGKLPLVAKNKDGQPLKSKVEALEDPRSDTPDLLPPAGTLDKSSIATTGGNGAPTEIKEWQAIMDHLRSLPAKNGETYKDSEGAWPKLPLRLHRRRNAPVLSGAFRKHPCRRAEDFARRRLSLDDRHDRPGDQLHQILEVRRAAEAVLHVFRPRRGPCPASRAQGMEPQIQRSVRPGLGKSPRGNLRPPAQVRCHSCGHKTHPAPRMGARMGIPLRRSEETLPPPV